MMRKARLLPTSSRPCLVLLLAMLAGSMASNPHPPPLPRTLLATTPPGPIELVDAMAADMLAFWATHGPDLSYGGYHPTLARDGAPIEPSMKGLVQHSRHLWAFSAIHQAQLTSPAGG